MAKTGDDEAVSRPMVGAIDNSGELNINIQPILLSIINNYSFLNLFILVCRILSQPFFLAL